MKLKFRADPKDWMIFGVFAFALLYLSAIAVLNLSSFASSGTFYGLNPFPAFTKEYFPPTMVVFIGALIAIVTSVSSIFFDREKGVGISASAKKDKGYARWATEKEMKKELVRIDPHAEHTDAAGIPLIMNKKGVWVDNSGYHNLIIGSTGAGKTQTTVFPMVKNLSKHDESMIITDPKGEIYEGTAEMLKDRGYNIVLLNFRDPQQGNSWNPLSLPYKLFKEGNSDKATEILDDLALNILYDESSKSQDPFWEKTSADYFAGLARALFEDATEDQINLNSINLMTTVGEDKFMGSTYMKEYFSYKDPTSTAYINVSSTLNAPNETKGSILSVFRQKIKLFATRDNLSEMLGHNDFDMKDIGRKKTAVFIVIQDEKKTYHSLVTIFLKQCYETLISVAQESGGKLPHRTNFILDEFANMPPLKDVTTMVTAARSRNIRFNFIIQNFAQLYEVYGKENGETIKGNCGNIVYLISSELSALEEISKMCGEVKSKEKEKTTSTPLVTVSDLQRLKMWNIIVLRIRMMPFKTVLTPNFEMDWGKEYPGAKYPQRTKLPVDIFDLKKYVETKKDAKMRELLGSSAPPMGGAFPSGGMNRPMMPGMNPMSPPAGMGGMPGMNMPSKPMQPPMPSTGVMPPFPGIPSPSMPSSSGGTMPSMPGMPTDGGFDVDDLIKRIDAKIAELEEEERQEKAKEEAAKVGKTVPKPTSVPPIPVPSINAPIQREPIPAPIRRDVPVTPITPTTPVRMPSNHQEPSLKIPAVEPVSMPKTPVSTIPTPPKEKVSIPEPVAIPSVPIEEKKPLPIPNGRESLPKVEVKSPVVESKEPIPVSIPTPVVPKVESTMLTPTIPTHKVGTGDMPKLPQVETKNGAVETTKNIDEEYITDDQFFDDFFNDDEE